MKRLHFLALIGLVALTGCPAPSDTSGGSTTTPPADTKKADASPAPAGDGKKQTIAFVTNNPDPFWNIAKKGIDKAAAELPDFNIEFKAPSEATAAKQKEILEDLVVKGVKGIAVSPVDPANMKADLDAIASKTALICHDSDAPDTNRLCYIGTDNIAAGRMAGEEVKKALPNGGKIMVFVGKKDAQNAKERYQGLTEALKGTKVQVLDIRTDDTDHARAKQNVSDTITANPDIAGLVGLWSYNGPAIINAVTEAKKENAIKIICFDEADETLKGIEDGIVSATIVQQPFEFGYQSAHMLADIVNGKKDAVPADKKKIIETKVVNKESVKEFSAKLAELRK
jgi:ribose transport system substrate-binding protein